MKQILSLLFAAAIILSCNDTAKVADANDDGADSSHAKNSENIKEVYRAIETGDVSKLSNFVADDFVDHNGNVDGSDLKGKDSVLKMLSQIHTYFEPGLKMEFISDATSDDGMYHYATVRMKGKAAANPWGMPVGADIDDTSVDVIKLRDGKATEHWGFMSMGDFNEIMKSMRQGEPATDKK